MIHEFTYEDVAGMIDHALLHPTLLENELFNGCELAATYRTATVCVKPCDVARASQFLESTEVGVCTVIGFPHGVNLTEIKVLETKRACEEGATEVDMVINLGKALSGHWKYVENDIHKVCQTAHDYKAKLKVIFENDYLDKGGAGLTGKELKLTLCRICQNIGADWVKTSTGFGYTQRIDGTIATNGAKEEDVSLMVKACAQAIQVKAAGGIKNLETLLRMRQIGATRIGTSSTRNILDECTSILKMPPISVVKEKRSLEY